MTDATELDLDAIRARLDAATEGPWHIGPDPHGREAVRSPRRDFLAECQWDADAEFIAHARTDVERLLAALDKAQRAAKTLGGIVEQNARMILDVTGLHDWIDEDGDGDWGAVWENAYELLPRLRAAESSLAAVRALVRSPQADFYRAEACRHEVDQPYADNRYVRLLDDVRVLVASTTERGGQ